MYQLRNLGVLFLVIAVCLLSKLVSAANVYDANYKSEVYATFPSSGLGWLKDMAFDPSGNLYITARGLSRDTTDGAVYRVDTQGNGSVFATGLYYPTGIVYSTSLEYGDNLYISDAGNSYAGSGGGIKRVDMNGNVSLFSSPSNQSSAINIDQTGNYGNRLYVATRGLDHMDAILPNGTIQHFSDFPYNMSGGGPVTLDFDLTGSYGNSMFIANNGSGSNSGIFEMDALGNPIRFAPEITTAGCLGFDNGTDFDGDMFVSSMLQSDSYWSIYRVSPDEEITKFADFASGNLTWFEFGPDGALYTLENAGGTAVVTRITPVPEPASIILLSFGAVFLKRRIS